jgi:hypothetical protein
VKLHLLLGGHYCLAQVERCIKWADSSDGVYAKEDAFIVARLREAGAIGQLRIWLSSLLLS